MLLKDCEINEMRLSNILYLHCYALLYEFGDICIITNRRSERVYVKISRKVFIFARAFS